MRYNKSISLVEKDEEFKEIIENDIETAKELKKIAEDGLRKLKILIF